MTKYAFMTGSLDALRRPGHRPRSGLGGERTLSASATPDSSLIDDEGWKPASTAPFDADLELAVIDEEGVHALVFPCRRVLGGWMNARTQELMTRLVPSHWRDWRTP
jgi:hypothetical protein